MLKITDLDKDVPVGWVVFVFFFALSCLKYMHSMYK